MESSQSHVLVALPAPISTKHLTGGVEVDAVSRDLCFWLLSLSTESCRLDKNRVVMVDTSRWFAIDRIVVVRLPISSGKFLLRRREVVQRDLRYVGSRMTVDDILPYGVEGVLIQSFLYEISPRDVLRLVIGLHSDDRPIRFAGVMNLTRGSCLCMHCVGDSLSQCCPERQIR